MAGTRALLEKIGYTLGVLTSNTRFRGNSGQSEKNISAEKFYTGLLNLVLRKTYPGLCLNPVNGKNMNFPSIDLVDRNIKVAIKIMFNGSWSKINDTLDFFLGQGLHKYFDRLIILVTGKKAEFKSMSRLQGDFYFECERDVWTHDLLFQRISDLDANLLQEVEAYLSNELNAIPPSERGLYLPFSAMEMSSFVGRQKELVELARRVANEDKREPIFIMGPSGMGKTALVATFCHDYVAGNVYYVRFYESFFRTIAEKAAAGLENYELRKPNRQRDFFDVLERLKNCSPADILVLDDVDEKSGNFSNLQKDTAWQALCALPLQLIIITRCLVDGAIEIGAMEKNTLRAMLGSSGHTLDDSEKDALIETTRGHTQTLNLIARMLKDNDNLTSQTLLAELGCCQTNDALQGRISDILRILLRQTVQSEQDIQLLRWATLLPTGGVKADYLTHVLPKEPLKKHIRNKWLQYDQNSGKLIMEPCVRQACIDELHPDDENCAELLNAVWEQYNWKEYNAVKYRQFAELFSQATITLADTQGNWATRAGILWNQVGCPDIARDYEEKAVEKLEQTKPATKRLAQAFNNLGQTYVILGDNQHAVEYLTKSLEIQEKVLQENDPTLAATYNNLGQLYCSNGNYAHAMEYQKKALTLRLKTLPLGHPSLVQSLNNLGAVYGYLGQYQNALALHLKALKMREQYLPSNHPDLARSYEAIGSAYLGVGEYFKALEHLRKAEHIWVMAMPTDHSQLRLLQNRIRQLEAWLADHA